MRVHMTVQEYLGQRTGIYIIPFLNISSRKTEFYVRKWSIFMINSLTKTNIIVTMIKYHY